MAHQEESLLGYLSFLECLPEPVWGFFHGLIGQAESSPVDGHRISSPDVSVYEDRLFRIHVGSFHEPAWFIGSYRNGRKVEIFKLTA